MGKTPKIAVYAICKNEEKFVDRWVQALSEADHIFVLDTGSTDNTVSKLRNYVGFVSVTQKIIEPWHFGNARNEALKLILDNYDICVVADLDHIFRPGWANLLRDAYLKGYHEIYGPIIDYDDNNKEIKRFLSKNVHPHDSHWWWERPIHEGIIFHPDDKMNDFTCITLDGFVIEHHPDRSKSRDNYLNLLEAEYQYNSKDPLCAIYYGCELCFHGREDEGNAVFEKALEECDFTNNNDILYTLHLNIADYYFRRNNFDESMKHCDAANVVDSNLHTRREYMYYAETYAVDEMYKLAEDHALNALSIPYVNSWLENDQYNKGEVYARLAYFAYENYLKHDVIPSLLLRSLAYSTLAKDLLNNNEAIDLYNNIVEKVKEVYYGK